MVPIILRILRRLDKIYKKNNYNSSMRIVSKIVDFSNHLQGKGATSVTISDEIRKLKYFLPDKLNIVIDVGGNIGDYSYELIKSFEIHKLIIFEPSKISYENLSKRFKDSSNIETINLGLSDKNTKESFFANFEGSPISSVYKRKLDHFNIDIKETEEIELIKFNKFWEKDLNKKIIDFIKIDVEGYEFFVLQGLEDSLNSIKVIQFEFGGTMIDSRTFFQDFYYFFTKNDFEIYRIKPLGLQKLDEYKETDEYFKYSNFIAVNKKLSFI